MKSRYFKVVSFLILINTFVYVLWIINGPSDFMVDNFLISWDALAEGRWWVLITSVFSHKMLIHFFLNMVVLSNFGELVERVLGSWLFLKFYLIAGIVSSLMHAMVSAFVLDAPDLPALGASGAIAGVILIFSLLFPREKIYLFGLVPLPAIIGALAFIGLDLWGLMAQAEGGGLPIGHGAHLGGAFTGVLFFFFYLRPRMKRR